MKSKMLFLALTLFVASMFTSCTKGDDYSDYNKTYSGVELLLNVDENTSVEGKSVSFSTSNGSTAFVSLDKVIDGVDNVVVNATIESISNNILNFNGTATVNNRSINLEGSISGGILLVNIKTTSEVFGKINKTYNAENLTLKYSGELLGGKSVTFTTTDGNTGILLLDRVVFGAGQISIDTKITDVKAESLVFSGSKTINGVEVKCDGSITNGKMSINVTAKQPKNELTGTWKLLVHDMSSGESPVIFNWLSDAPGLVIPGMIDEPWPTMYMGMLVSALVGPMVNEVLQDVEFLEDGNLVAHYSSNDGQTWTKSPINLINYRVDETNKVLYLMPNIKNIIEESQKKSVTDILPLLADILKNGIPVKYEIIDGKLNLSLETEFLKPVMSMLPAILPMITGGLDPEMAGMLNGMLPSLTECINTTTEIKLGLIFIK